MKLDRDFRHHLPAFNASRNLKQPALKPSQLLKAQTGCQLARSLFQKIHPKFSKNKPKKQQAPCQLFVGIVRSAVSAVLGYLVLSHSRRNIFFGKILNCDGSPIGRAAPGPKTFKPQALGCSAYRTPRDTIRSCAGGQPMNGKRMKNNP